MRKTRIEKSFRLLHIDLFFKYSIKECIISINLFMNPFKTQCQSNHNSNNGKLDHKATSFLEIKTKNLILTFWNLRRLDFLNDTCCKFLIYVHPFTTNEFSSKRSWHQIQDFSSKEIKLNLYQLMPPFMSDSLLSILRFCDV